MTNYALGTPALTGDVLSDSGDLSDLVIVEPSSFPRVWNLRNRDHEGFAHVMDTERGFVAYVWYGDGDELVAVADSLDSAVDELISYVPPTYIERDLLASAS